MTEAVEKPGRIGGREIRVVIGPRDEYRLAGFGSDHDPERMLEQFGDRLGSLEEQAEVAALLDHLAASPRPAVLWRTVVAAAATSDAFLAELGSVAELVESIGSTSLNSAVAKVVNARFAGLATADQALVEAAVVALEADPVTHSWPAVDQFRRLLHSLDPALVSPSTAARISEVAPPREMSSVIDYGDDDDGPFGIGLVTAEDEAAWAAMKPVKQFGREHLNGVPDATQIETNVEAVRALRSVDFDGLAPGLAELADELIARCAAVWARQGDGYDPAVMDFARELLLEMSTSELPTHEEADDESRQMLRSGPRQDAADALPLIARHGGFASQDVLDAIQELAADPVPSIRRTIADRADCLRLTAPEVMWAVLEDRAMNDDHDEILQTVAMLSWRLRDDSRSFDLTRRVANRCDRSDRRNSAVSTCLDIAALRWLLWTDGEAKALLDELLGQVTAEVVSTMLHCVRKAECFTSADDGCRNRTFTLCSDLLDVALPAVERWAALGEDPSDEDIAVVRHGVDAAKAVTDQLFFASGAHARSDEGSPTAEEVRFADEASVLFDRLAVVPHPEVSHRLVQSVALVLDERPGPTLQVVWAVVVGGGRLGGYQLESLAVSTVVRIVERLLADHRGVLQDPAALDALREVLEVFIDAGWPETVRVTFEFEQVFR